MMRAAGILGAAGAVAVALLLLSLGRGAGAPRGAAVTAGGPAPRSEGQRSPQAFPVLFTTAAARDMRQVLEVSGTLRAEDDVQVGARLAGRVARVTVREGDRVSAGQVLVLLDDRESRAQLARAQGLLSASLARLALARDQATWKDATAATDLERARANLNAAKARLKYMETSASLVDVETRIRVETAQSGRRVALERLSIVRETTRKQELRQAQLAVDQASAELAQVVVDMQNARQVFERRRTLFAQDAIAKEEVDEAERRLKAAQAAVRVSEAGVSMAGEKLELAKEGSRPEEVRVAEEAVRSAEQALEQARSDERRRDVAQDEVAAARSALRQSEAAVLAAQAGLAQPLISAEEVRGAQAGVDQARADIAFYENQLADLTVRAPVGGVVSQRMVHPGETVSPNTALLHLVALDTVYFEALVPELEVSLLRPGGPAAVTVDALKGRTFAGTVREVIPVADRQTRAFRVRVAVPGAGKTLPVGAFARAQVEVGRRRQAVAILKDAVYNDAGEHYVWVIAEGAQGEGGSTVARRRTVVPGLIEERYAEVARGLSPGERVVASGTPAIIEGSPLRVEGEWLGLPQPGAARVAAPPPTVRLPTRPERAP